MLQLDQFLPYRLSVASNAVSARISATYRKRFGLKIAEWRLVAILAEGGEMTPLAIGRAARIDKISVSRAASALIARGLISQRANPDDGRSHLLSLTATGQSLYTDVAPAALAMERDLLASLTADERILLDRLLRRIETAAGSDFP